MGMSTHIVGFRPPDERWNKMKAIWESCEAAGVPVPGDVSEFFEQEDPADRPGMEIDISDAVCGYGSEGHDGYEVDISKLPDGVSVVRFYNSY